MAADASEVEVIVKFANGGRLTLEDLAMIEAIRAERSILAASRATGVSYRKCWLMVDALNRTFETPVFATFPGTARWRRRSLRFRRAARRTLPLHGTAVAERERAGACRAQCVSRSVVCSTASGEAAEDQPRPRLSRSRRS